MKKTAMQELIQWTIENAENITAANGNTYIAIDHEEMRKYFDGWIEKEKQQLIAFGYSQIQEIDSEIGDLVYKKVPEEIYNETFA